MIPTIRSDIDVTARAVRAPWLAVLAGPLSFGITGPTLVLGEVAGDLGVSLVAATSLVTAFGLGVAVGTPLMGVLLARRGPRSALVACAMLITAGALLVLAVPVLPALLVGSVLQALGSAGMTVVAMSLAGSPAAMGVVASSLASVGALAPLIGSQLSTATSWQLTLVLPVLSLLGLPAVLRARGRAADTSGPGPARERFDLFGAVLLVGLVTALVVLPHRPLPAGLVALVLGALFALHLHRTPNGFVPVAVLANRRFVLASGLAFVLAVANFGIIYAVPGLIAGHTGWTAAQLGMAFLVPYLLGGVSAVFLVTASARLRFPTLAAVLAAAAVLAVAAVTLGAGWLPLIFAAMLTGSLAAATGQGALALRAGSAVPVALRPTALGLLTFSFLLGAAFGPAIAALATS